MPKVMAQLRGNRVVNLLWCPDGLPQTDDRKDLGDHPVQVGDTWEEGLWYREGAVVLTPLEEARQRIAALEEQNADQAAALAALYQGVTQ